MATAPLAVMQECAHRAQKLHRWAELFARGFLQQSFFGGPGALFVHGGEKRHPAGNVVVAETARCLFDVRLKMKDGAAILRVT